MSPGNTAVRAGLAYVLAIGMVVAPYQPLFAQTAPGAPGSSGKHSRPASTAPAPAPRLMPGSAGTAQTSSTTSAPSATPPAGPGAGRLFYDSTDTDKLDATHDQNNTLSMDQLRLNSAVKPEQFKPIRLEVSYDELITLKDAVNYALENNLAIKISNDSMRYQKYVLYGQVANALPNLSMAYNLTKTNILNEGTSAFAKVFLTRVTYPVFQGGSVVYSILGQYYRMRGWKQAFKASVNDELLDVYQKYNSLVLNRALLQIRAKAVEVSEEQLRVNKAMEKAGTGTKFAVLQADAQLSSDKQALLQQQIAVRQSALALNFSMNYPMAVNLVPAEESIAEAAIFQNESSVETLLGLALHNRPELREYEDFKFAAARNIQVAAAPLYPQASFFTQYSYTNTQNSGTPSSSSSGGGGGGTGNAGAGVFGGLFETYQQGFALVWSLNNFGLTSMANLFAAGSLNRQAIIQANQELQTIIQQIRTDFLNWRAAREQIDNAAHSVRASQEELRLARLRLGVGVATELDVVQAQRDYINSLTAQAQAIVNSNLAQAQLLHDTGLITRDTLLNGYKGKLK